MNAVTAARSLSGVSVDAGAPRAEPARRAAAELSEPERRLLAVAQNYPLCGIHADALAEDAGLIAEAAEGFIAALAADEFLVEPPPADVDASGKRCWTVGRFNAIRDAGISAQPPPPKQPHAGPLPDWLHPSFWNHPDTGALRLPEDGDYVAARLLAEPKAGRRQRGWALAHLDSGTLDRVKAHVDDWTARRIDHEIDLRRALPNPW